MYSAEYVAEQINVLKNSGIPLSDVAWQTAMNCVGWPYVFGAAGQECTPAYRRQAYNAHGSSHPTIKTKCKNFNGDKSCSGCQWLPGGKRVRCFDCRGLTRWVLQQVYGWTLQGAGATSQWNMEDNWKAKGTIDSIPNDTLVCLFVKKGNTMEHTGFGYHGATIEASSGVQYFEKRKSKWTHWGQPKCVEGGTPVPEPTPQPGYAIVTGNRLALREGPSTNAKVLTRIEHGSTVKIEAVPPEWEYVSYGNKKGFVMKQYIKEG